MNNNYDDLIHLNRHVSNVHKAMPIEKRALQFAPFSALTGYEDAVKEVARLTDKRIEIDDGLKEMINSQINEIKLNINSKPTVSFTYFVYDNKKDGGTYKEITGAVKRIDEANKLIILVDGVRIPIDEIINIRNN